MNISLIPLPYKIGFALLFFTILIGSSFAYGYNKAENKYLVKIATYKQEAELLETRLNASLSEVKVEVLTKYVDRVKKVKEIVYVTQDVIKYVPSKCELSNGWVSVHNAGATSDEGVDASIAADGTSSGIKDVEALTTIVDNYGTCRVNAERLKSLQEYVIRREEEIKKFNEEALER